jgi:hypothetical protein
VRVKLSIRVLTNSSTGIVYSINKQVTVVVVAVVVRTYSRSRGRNSLRPEFGE